MLHQRAETAAALAGTEACQTFFAPCLASAGPDRLWVAHVDEQARCVHLASHRWQPGETGLPTREILRDAACHGSAGVVLAHRRAEPDAGLGSGEGLANRQLAAAAQALNTTLLDHLVFAGADCTSMRRAGLL